MLLMVEKGIRGGVSMISNRYGKANNKYMGEPTPPRLMLNRIIYIINLITHLKVAMINTSYDPSKPSKYLTYLDANNLYGAAMSMKLPTSGFKWMNKYELNHWEKYPCILEVDLEYPKELHDLHNDYPIAPERIMMCKNKVEKLIPNLRDKKKYIIHYKTSNNILIMD